MSGSSTNNNNKKPGSNYLSSASHTTPSHTTPITRAPVYSPPSMWENIKMGFGVTMGNRIFNGIFGDPTVNVKVDQTPTPTPAPAPVPVTLAPATLVTYNKCDYLKDEIKLNKCDNEELNSNKCDELFRQMYKCKHNM